MKRTLSFIFILLFCISVDQTAADTPLTAPRLTNNPSQGVVVTNKRPLFSIFNASGGIGKRAYELQIDTVLNFDSDAMIEYRNIPQENKYISSKRLKAKNSLKDKTKYYWRVRAVDSQGRKGPWALSWFYLDTKADDAFMNMVRVPVSMVTVSSGQNPKNIVDLDDPGQSTFWQASPPGLSVQWAEFDLGKLQIISRFWMFSNPSGPGGWLKNFVWQISSDKKRWIDIPGASVEKNNIHRNIININSVTTRYLRLLISDWYGYAPQINAITIYSPGSPPVPESPEGNYVLIVGNQQDGFTFTELAKFIEDLNLDLKTLTVPHYEISLEMVNKLKRKPVAIILSGNNADYSNLPMFEYNGEYEIIRECDIPILGICCGHQQIAMAYGYTFARSMGWSDISSLTPSDRKTRINILKEDPVFEGIPDLFIAPEIHGWAIAVLPQDFEQIATSTYIQAIRSTTRMIYGEQFHAEIRSADNQGTLFLVNFLKMAIKKSKEKCL